MKVKNLPTTTGGSTSDFLIKNLAGGGTEKITVANLYTLMGGAASYLRYVALLTQTGTSAPTAIVLENTLGGTVVWTRTAVGEYAATLSGAFTANKTMCVIGSEVGTLILPPLNSFLRTNSNEIKINTCDITVINADALLSNTSIEIRVYP